jgi:hypothetical protein
MTEEESFTLIAMDSKCVALDNNMGLYIPPETQKPELLSALRQVRTTEEFALWAKADILKFARDRWGVALIKMLNLSKYEQKIMGTAYLFPHETRRTDLSFTHHRICFELGVKSTKVACRWLAKAALNEWGHADLMREIRYDGADYLPNEGVQQAMNQGYLSLQSGTTFLAQHPIKEQPIDWLMAMRRRLDPFAVYREEIDDRIKLLVREVSRDE